MIHSSSIYIHLLLAERVDAETAETDSARKPIQHGLNLFLCFYLYFAVCGSFALTWPLYSDLRGQIKAIAKKKHNLDSLVRGGGRNEAKEVKEGKGIKRSEKRSEKRSKKQKASGFRTATPNKSSQPHHDSLRCCICLKRPAFSLSY